MREKIQSASMNLIRFYIALNTEEKNVFYHPKSKLGRYSKCNDWTVRIDVLVGYSVTGVQIVVMVRSRWMRVVWATACHCKFAS